MPRDLPLEIKKVRGKDDILDYCRWYVLNKGEPARASEIVTYAIDNRLVGRRFNLTVQRVTQTLKRSDEFKVMGKSDGRILWGLVNGKRNY